VFPAAGLSHRDSPVKAANHRYSGILDHVVSKHVQSVLQKTNGKINGKNGAAELLGINASTLRHKMRKMKIPFGRNIHKKHQNNS
jgi:DNA-binding protein Fis